MEIVNIRIDERLIHGQVATAWTQHLHPSRIMVVDAAAIKDDIQKMALKMACPPGVKLSILSPRKAAENLSSGKYTGERIFMVMKNPASLRQIYEAGFTGFGSVTVGNMSVRGNCKNVGRTVNVNEQDIENFKFLGEKGVKVVTQMVPNDSAADLLGQL